MDRVLIAIDGDEQAGPATAYLIERVHGGCTNEFVVITVQAPPARPPRAPDGHSNPSQLHRCVARSRRKKRHSVEGARPWLDDAGVPYQFFWETGELSQVVSRLMDEQDFSEVVVVSRQASVPNRLLGPLMGRTRSSYLQTLQTRWRTRISLITTSRGHGRHT